MNEAKAGDIILTVGGNRIKLTEAPRWNDHYKSYYAYANRLLKTQGTFSNEAVLHYFKDYEMEV